MDLMKVVVATGNSGKVKEISAMLQHLPMQLFTQTSRGVTPVEETGLTFVENAILKARNAAKNSGMPAIADDSGLEVDALRGQPGIRSARYSGVDASDEENNIKLLRVLAPIIHSKPTARFQCVLVFMRHADDPTPAIFQGTWEGTIVEEPKGQNGFGYDPIFFVPDHQCTSAELPAEIKNKISHRGQALQQFCEFFTEAFRN